MPADAPDSMTIADLLTQARGSDPRRLDQLFGQCRNYLAVVARAQVESWLRAKVDASDIVQQTMLEAYRDFHKFRGTTEAEWLAWLRQILNHNAANFIQRLLPTHSPRSLSIRGPKKSAVIARNARLNASERRLAVSLSR